MTRCDEVGSIPYVATEQDPLPGEELLHIIRIKGPPGTYNLEDECRGRFPAARPMTASYQKEYASTAAAVLSQSVTPEMKQQAQQVKKALSSENIEKAQKAVEAFEQETTRDVPRQEQGK